MLQFLGGHTVGDKGGSFHRGSPQPSHNLEDPNHYAEIKDAISIDLFPNRFDVRGLPLIRDIEYCFFMQGVVHNFTSGARSIVPLLI